MEILPYLCLAPWLTGFILTLIGTLRSHRHFQSVPPHLDAPFNLFPVSILKPLKGVDPDLKRNLTSFFNLDYPKFELIFSVADKNELAIPLIQELIKQHPNTKARLIIGETNYGANPKINNLLQSYKESNFDWILISDSNVRVNPDYLTNMLAHVKSDTGIITGVIAGADSQTFGGDLESMYLNTFYARWMILTDLVGQNCVVGKSMLFKKSEADRFGGLKILSNYLAEDYMAGQAMKMLGRKVVLMFRPVIQPVGDLSFETFWARHIRWGRIRKSQAFLAFLVEFFICSWMSGLLGAFAFQSLFGIPFLLFLFCHMLFWSFCDLILFNLLKEKNIVEDVNKAIQKSNRLIPLNQKSSLQWDFFIWILRETLHIPLWFHTLCGDTVLWRGRKLKLYPGGLLETPTLNIEN